MTNVRKVATAIPLSILCATLTIPWTGETSTPTPTRSVESDPSADLIPRDGNQALEWLLKGNARFADGKSRHDHESIRRRMRLTEGQHPFGIVLGCADSRVPPELVFDEGLGDLFVIRVAGNVVAEDEAGSIEYAVAHLDQRLIVVLGHEGCGAVTAALSYHDNEPEELIRLVHRIEPALADVDRSIPMKEQIHLGVEVNVRQSVRQLLDIVERQQATDRVVVVGMIYELETGRVRLLD